MVTRVITGTDTARVLEVVESLPPSSTFDSQQYRIIRYMGKLCVGLTGLILLLALRLYLSIYEFIYVSAYSHTSFRNTSEPGKCPATTLARTKAHNIAGYIDKQIDRQVLSSTNSPWLLGLLVVPLRPQLYCRPHSTPDRLGLLDIWGNFACV